MPSDVSMHCRERLASLMAEENAQLATLEELLTQEHALLEARDMERLDKTATARQQCIGHLLRIEEERRALCRAAGRSDDADGLLSLLAWCDPTELLLPAVKEYRDRTRRCREQNDRNGILVNGRLQRNLSLPDVREGGTYGPGSDNRGGYGRKLVTRA
jgi:flagellar biosynthesis/type III secretory pathway chaperone